MVEHLLSMHEDLGSISNSSETKINQTMKKPIMVKTILPIMVKTNSMRGHVSQFPVVLDALSLPPVLL